MEQPEGKSLEPGSNLEPESKPRSSNLKSTSNLVPASNPDVISLVDYLEIIARRWRMIAKVTAAAAVISVA